MKYQLVRMWREGRERASKPTQAEKREVSRKAEPEEKGDAWKSHRAAGRQARKTC